MGCTAVATGEPSNDNFADSFLKPLRKQMVEQGNNVQRRWDGGTAHAKHSKMCMLNGSMQQFTEGRRSNSHSLQHESFDSEAQSKDRSPRHLIRQSTSVVRKATLQNVLPQHGSFIHLNGKLIFLEQQPKHVEPTGEELFELLQKNNIALGSFLVGDRTAILKRLREEAQKQYTQHREEVVRQFDRDPIVVHLYEQYERVRGTIFEQ